MVLAVGEQDDGSRPRGRAVVYERTSRHAERRGQGGPSSGRRVELDRVEKQFGGSVIEGQGAQQHRLPGEGHQSEAIACETSDQGTRGVHGLTEAIGGHVLGGHAPRGVEHHDDIHAGSRDRLEPRSPLRARRRQHGARGREQP